MSAISTNQQKVDMTKFGPSHEKTFGRKKKGKTGSTKYVWRDGQLMVRDEADSKIMVIPNIHHTYHETVERLNREVLQSYQIATPADLP